MGIRRCIKNKYLVTKRTGPWTNSSFDQRETAQRPYNLVYYTGNSHAIELPRLLSAFLETVHVDN